MKNGMGGAGGNNNDGGGNSGGGGNNGGIPPELMEALTEALNDDDFKKTLEQIGKEVGKDHGKVCMRVGYSNSVVWCVNAVHFLAPQSR